MLEGVKQDAPTTQSRSLRLPCYSRESSTGQHASLEPLTVNAVWQSHSPCRRLWAQLLPEPEPEPGDKTPTLHPPRRIQHGRPGAAPTCPQSAHSGFWILGFRLSVLLPGLSVAHVTCPVSHPTIDHRNYRRHAPAMESILHDPS